MVYVVETETSNHDTLLNMADKRGNIVPIVYCMSPDPMRYRMLINMVDVMFAAPDRPEEVILPSLFNLLPWNHDNFILYNYEVLSWVFFVLK